MKSVLQGIFKEYQSVNHCHHFTKLMAFEENK